MASDRLSTSAGPVRIFILVVGLLLTACSLSIRSEPAVPEGFECVRWEQVYDPTYDRTEMQCQSYVKATQTLDPEEEP